MANLAEMLRNERKESLKEKYEELLGKICSDIRKKGVSEYWCPNDCDTTANNLTEFLINEGFSVERVLFKPWIPGSYTKYLLIRA